MAGHFSPSELSELEHPGFLFAGNHAPLDTEEMSRRKNVLLASAHSRDAIVSGRIISLGHQSATHMTYRSTMTNRRFFMPKKKSLIRASIEELDTKNAIGQSRFAAKQARREQGEKIWAFSTEQYHSHGTRRTYQEHILHFLNWCRDQHHLTELTN
jgi:hypothetical protein